MTTKPPWEAIHSFLTDARLRIIAAIILFYRSKKRALRMPEDNAWNLGCDCYQWVKYGIRKAAEGKYTDWLSVTTKEDDLGFLFVVGGVGGVPAKFYREDSPGQPGRTIRVSELEELARQDSLPFVEELPPDEVIRFAVVSDDDGQESVQLVQLDRFENIKYLWPISTDAVVLDLSDERREEGIDLGEPPVEMPEDAERVDPKKKDKEKGA